MNIVPPRLVAQKTLILSKPFARHRTEFYDAQNALLIA
jgi:hypothetical protein